MDTHDRAVASIATSTKHFYARKEAFGIYHGSTNSTLLGNGEVVRASSTENADLFYGAVSSFGTLGVTTLLEIQLKEAKKYVATTYKPVSSIFQAQFEIQKATEDETVDYLDGIMYSAEFGVICVGRLTNSLPQANTSVQRFTRPTDPWFYIHVQRLPHKISEPITEAIPLVDYLFRYDRGGFWVAKFAFKYFLTPFNRLTRFLLDYFMHTRVMYHALHQSGLSSKYIIQDVAIPYSQAGEFMSYLEDNFKSYPIWLCPLKQNIASTHSLQVAKTQQQQQPPETMLNFGVWGPGSTNREEFVVWNRALEKEVRRLGGQKWLYAHTYYTQPEFDEIYNRERYDALRAKYHATYLPTVYDKVKVDIAAERRAKESWEGWLLALFWGIWPLAGLYGVYKSLMGGDYLLPRTSKRVESS